MVQIDLKNVLTKHFPTMQSFTNVLQNRYSYKFLDICKKMSVLESLFNKVTCLMACNSIKNRCLDIAQVFSCEYHKMFENGFLLMAASENG